MQEIKTIQSIGQISIHSSRLKHGAQFFVTWVYVQAFGEETAEKLLKHYPYVYCPTLGTLFTKHANPEKGSIVIFYNNGTFTHTGIVTEVNGDQFKTNW